MFSTGMQSSCIYTGKTVSAFPLKYIAIESDLLLYQKPVEAVYNWLDVVLVLSPWHKTGQSILH